MRAMIPTHVLMFRGYRCNQLAIRLIDPKKQGSLEKVLRCRSSVALGEFRERATVVADGATDGPGHPGPRLVARPQRPVR